jgi:hypothetical protein
MRKVNALSAVFAVLITAGLSGVVASNAASTPTIYACVSKTSSLTKVSTKPHACPKGTLKLSWGTTGPKGATGSQGAQGPAGEQGYAGEQGPAGAEGPAGAQGPEGPAGAQGPAGQDGSGLTIYTAYDGGQDNNILGWSGTDSAYEIATTPTVPVGTYFVSATSSFRNGTGANYCWINLDSIGHWGVAAGVDVMGDNSTAVSAVVYVGTPSTLSFSCYGDTATTNFTTQLTAVKVSSLNPN